MKVIDLIGNTLESGDTVVVSLDHVIGVIGKIDGGAIAQTWVTRVQRLGYAFNPAPSLAEQSAILAA